MKTDQLIRMLAQGAGPAPRAQSLQRLGTAAALGGAASLAGAMGLIGPISADMLGTAAPWMKLGYTLALVLAAGWLTARLARPAAAGARAASALAAVVLSMAAFGAVSLGAMPAGERAAALLGHSARSCPWIVFGLSLPALWLTLRAVSSLAPTRGRLTGFAAGLFAGALGASGYALACDELAPSFVATWYTLGILLVGLLGAVLGKRLERW